MFPYCECNSVTMKAIKTQTKGKLHLCNVSVNPSSFGLPIGHMRDGVILLPRPECFVKMLSYSNVFSHGNNESIGKINLTTEATSNILVLVVKWRHHANGLLRPVSES